MNRLFTELRGGGGRTLAVLLLLLLLLPLSTAQDSKPTIALLSMGYEYSQFQTGALLDTLLGYEFITAEERATLEGREDIEGEKLNIFWGISDRSAADANIVVENAMDREPDAVVIFATTMAQMAANMTSDIEDPPALFFTAVADPYGAGVADASCIKPAHITGVQSVQDYDVVFDALLMQQPEIDSVGLLLATGDQVSESGAAAAVRAAEALGISTTEASVVDLSDLALATDGLVSKGVDAIVMPASVLLLPGGGIVVEAAKDAGIPVVTPMLTSIYEGVTMGIGHYRLLEEGYAIGRILAGWLNGEVDIASTGISQISDVAFGLNLNSAQLAGIEVPEELLAMADTVLVGDQVQMSAKMVKDQYPQMAEFPDEMVLMLVQAAGLEGVEIVENRIQMPLAVLAGESSEFNTSTFTVDMEADAAYVAGLHCTDEMIAQQQAALAE